MTFDDLKENIRTWIVNITAFADKKVIFSHGKGPRPTGQYAVLNIISIEKLIEDVRTETRLGGGEIQADYKGIRKVMASINIYRDNTTEQMINLKTSLSKITTQDYFNALDIGIIEPNTVNHIPEQIGKSWEDRSQCDFFFHYMPTITSDPDISEIKEIVITNEINDEVINISDI